MEFLRCNPTDFAKRSAHYRLTFSRGRALGWLAPKWENIWRDLPSLGLGAVVSPQPADAPVVTMDFKAAATLATMSVGELANKLNNAVGTGLNLDRVEAIDAAELSVSTAAQERAQIDKQATQRRNAANPFNVFGDLKDAAMYLAIGAAVIGGLYLVIVYAPKPKRRGR